MTRRVILGTAGHIDHGKTSLVRCLTGVDTDRLPAERQRGITIDIGFAQLDAGDCTIGIVDVPGHERFIRNMLAGASGIDMAMLVIAADDGVMPQTREHLAILRLLGVRFGLIALTKCDLVESEWLEVVEDDIRALLAGTFLEKASIIRTSAATSAGMDELRRTIADIARSITVTFSREPFRLPIDRAFVHAGLGTIVTGSVWSGTLAQDDAVELVPDGRIVRVRSIQSFNTSASSITRSQRAALNLAGIHHTQLSRGQTLATPGFLKPATKITVHLSVLPDAPRPIRHRQRVRLHIGTAELHASVRLLDSNELAPDSAAFAQLIITTPVCATGFQPFVIRAESPVVTLGGGVVLDPTASTLKRHDAAALASLESLRTADHQGRTRIGASMLGLGSWTDLDLARQTGLNLDDLDAAFKQLTVDHIITTVEAAGAVFRVTTDHLQHLTERITRTLERLHKQSPLDASIPRSRVVSALSYIEANPLNALLDQMLSKETLTGDQNVVALASHGPALTARQKQIYDSVVSAFHAAAFTPPDAASLADSLSAPRREVDEMMRLATQQGAITHLSGSFFLHRDTVKTMRSRITGALTESDGMTMAQMRDLLGTSRKYAVPIGEYCDRIGLTKRRGDLRVLRETS